MEKGGKMSTGINCYGKTVDVPDEYKVDVDKVRLAMIRTCRSGWKAAIYLNSEWVYLIDNPSDRKLTLYGYVIGYGETPDKALSSAQYLSIDMFKKEEEINGDSRSTDTKSNFN